MRGKVNGRGTNAEPELAPDLDRGLAPVRAQAAGDLPRVAVPQVVLRVRIELGLQVACEVLEPGLARLRVEACVLEPGLQLA